MSTNLVGLAQLLNKISDSANLGRRFHRRSTPGAVTYFTDFGLLIFGELH